MPRAVFELQCELDAAHHDKRERFRTELTAKFGRVITEDELEAYIIDRLDRLCPAKKAADVEDVVLPADAKTPQNMIDTVRERDHVCRGCGSDQNLHCHHIVWRYHGGPTCVSNLALVCNACHGKIHDGILFPEGSLPNLKFVDKRGDAIEDEAPPLSPRLTIQRPVESAVQTADCGKLSYDEIPDVIDAAWFKRYGELVDWTKKGALIIKPGARR